MNEEQPRYLGDGVYVTTDRGMVKLYTSDGLSETNVVYLEPEVLRAFLRWAEEK